MMLSSARVVAHRRLEPADSLDFFPTPPWAVRALFVHVLGTKGFAHLTVEEPACGEGHMAYALEDYFGSVVASDIHPYGYGAVRDFLAPFEAPAPDWIITNPPFKGSTAFMLRAVQRARLGCAMFVRLQYLEGHSRWRRLFKPYPPTIVAQFVERVPLHRGRWEPDGGTLSAYCWLVWLAGQRPRPLVWIPPCRERLLFDRDLARFKTPAA